MKKLHLYLTSLTILIALAIYTFAQFVENTDAHQACCISEDGYCRDILVRSGEPACGAARTKYTLLSTEKNCIMIEECCTDIDCKEGKCIIRGKEQPDAKQRFICAALCEEVGECECPGGLDTCTGDWDWIAPPESE